MNNGSTLFHTGFRDMVLLDPIKQGAGIENVTLTLLAKNGETGTRSGLNWGQRVGIC